jgi:hypothetical protein
MFIIFTCFALFIACTKIEKKQPVDEIDQEIMIHEAESLNDTTYEHGQNKSVINGEVKFEREQTFKSSDDVLLGVMGDFTVDANNRVYIADRDQTVVHVFYEDGRYNTSIGREGNGPAEFSAISPNTKLRIDSNKLYVPSYANSYNFFPDRLQVFDLTDFTFIMTINLIGKNRQDYSNELSGYYPLKYNVLESTYILVAYNRSPNDYKDDESHIKFMIQDSTSRILKGPIIQQKDRKQLIHTVTKTEIPYEAIKSFSFFSKSLFAISDDDVIYTARSEEFKVDVRNTEGTILRTISHPYTNLPVTRGELIDLYEEKETSVMGDGVEEAMIAEADSIPDTWPALNELLVDDENRLWVSTIVEDFDVYEWWILEESGELITTFKWPRDETIEVIKNGKMYTRETDEGTGLQQVVRYRIEME